jgi:two-component system sensor histidine kinase/response regulator
MLAPKRLILLEQNEDLANFISDILTAARYQVMWLVSTESAIRQIAVLQPDAVIIDLSIGEEFVGQILRNITTRINLDNIKIMAISNHEDTVRSTIAESIDEYLYQPIVPEQMLKKIAKLLS